jgi:hypothetical protein
VYRQLAHPSQLPHHGWRIPDVARSGQLDALIALKQIGTRLQFSRNQEVYAQGQAGGFWYKVISGTVRITKLRRMVAGISPSSASAATRSVSTAPRSAGFRPKRLWMRR